MLITGLGLKRRSVILKSTDEKCSVVLSIKRKTDRAYKRKWMTSGIRVIEME